MLHLIPCPGFEWLPLIPHLAICRIELTREDTGVAYLGQLMGILTPNHLPELPATSLTLHDSTTALLKFYDAGSLNTCLAEENLICSYHDHVINAGKSGNVFPS